MMAECDFYINLFDDFVKTQDNEIDKILWKTHKIVDLMNFADEKDMTGFMENALRMIMLLYRNFRLNSCDLSSIDLNETSPDKKKELQVILKTEFT